MQSGSWEYNTLNCTVPPLPAGRYNITISIQDDRTSGLPTYTNLQGYGLAVPNKYQWRAMNG